MIRIKKNKPKISADVRSFRTVRRLNINRTYTSLKVGVAAGYVLLGLMVGILLHVRSSCRYNDPVGRLLTGKGLHFLLI